MRRLLMVSAVAALMAAMMTVISAPAMAIDLDFNDDDDDRNDFVFFDDDDFDDFFGFGNDGFFDSALDQESESGDLETSFEVSNTGDYASQCVPALQFGNTGNFNNAPTFVQGFGSELDDFEPGGIEFAVEPELAVDCSNTIQQSSAASSYWW